MALSHSAPLDRVLTVSRKVTLCAKGASRGRSRRAMRGDVPPPTTLAIESVCRPSLLEGANPITASEELDSTLAKMAVSRLAENRSDN